MPITSAISVSLNGSQPINASAWANTVGGDPYQACITIQYGYKPSGNSTWLTVEPQATELASATKTQEQLQQEAESSGWLTIWHEFTWSYPWYRCHLRVNCTLPQGQLYMDYGWTFLPFGQTFECNTVAVNLINDLAYEVYEHGKDILWDLIKGYFVGIFIQHFAALLLGKTLAGFVGAVVMYTLYCSVETLVLYFSSGNNPYAWLAAFIASAIGGTYGLFMAGLDTLVDWLTAAGRRLMQEISHFMKSCWARGLDFFDITGIAFSLMDFAFAALDLHQFVTLIG